MEKKLELERIDESIYNISNEDNSIKKLHGLSKEVIIEISKDKKEPKWMTDLRLAALDKYYELENPIWGPDLKEIESLDIAVYLKPNANKTNNWDDLPEDIKATFTRLGLPQAEIDSLARN